MTAAGARLKLVLAYDGTGFAGWQSQAHGRTVQDELERTFAEVCGEHVRVHGAGRTDAGVHALGQCAHADLPSHRFTPERWLRALNGLLPREIRVLRARYVSPAFHARFSARGKVYCYRIVNAPVLSPFDRHRAWHVPTPLNFGLLAATAQHFAGTHDFASFAANRGKSPPESTVRTLHAVRVRRTGTTITLEFDGDGFLYKMVRLLTGALVRCAEGKLDPAQIERWLAEPGRAKCGFVAPANGLFLIRVRY